MKQTQPLLSMLLVLGLLSSTSFSSYADDDDDNSFRSYYSHDDDDDDDYDNAEHKTQKALEKARKSLHKAGEKLEKALEKAKKALEKAQKDLDPNEQYWQSVYDDLLLEYQAYFETEEQPNNNQFQFALIGDAPYQRDLSANFGYLADSVNRDEDISFSIHIGDFKSGNTECSNERFMQSKDLFNLFNQPLIYTPGDNEWTDCHRASNGNYLPTERLDYLRELFFPAPAMSLGQNPMPLTSQADNPDSAHAAYAENVMWREKGVIFATFNVTGTGNDLLAWNGLSKNAGEGCVETHTDCGVPDSFLNPRAERLNEFKAREQAVLDWLDQVFNAADNEDSPAVVLAFQANPNFEKERYAVDRQGFNNIIDRIEQLTIAFGKPVLLMHGDYHQMFIAQRFGDQLCVPVRRK